MTPWILDYPPGREELLRAPFWLHSGKTYGGTWSGICWCPRHDGDYEGIVRECNNPREYLLFVCMSGRGPNDKKWRALDRNHEPMGQPQ